MVAKRQSRRNTNGASNDCAHFAAKSSPSCANFCLRQTAIEFGHLYDHSIGEIVNNNFYLDDCLVSLHSVQEVIAVRKSLSELLVKRGFILKKWISNSDEVLQTKPESKRADATKGHAIGIAGIL